MASLTARASVGSIFATVGAAANSITVLANGLSVAAGRFNNYMNSEAQLQEIKASEKLIEIQAVCHLETDRKVAEKLVEIDDWSAMSKNHHNCLLKAEQITMALRRNQPITSTEEE